MKKKWDVSVRIFLAFILFVGIALFAAPLSKEKGKVKKESTSEVKLPTKQLLFFMNPNGSPCQRQKAILDGVMDSLAKLAKVVYIQTTVSEDMAKFQAYGIRGLPMLIIADQEGKELSRFTPGVQGAEAVLSKLRK